MNGTGDNNSQKMEQFATKLAKDVTDRNSEIIRLTLENERLRAQLNARNEAGSQSAERDASSSGLDQLQRADDYDEACDMACPSENDSCCEGEIRTLRRRQKRKYVPESEEGDDSEHTPIKAEGKKTRTTVKGVEKEKRPGRLPSGVLKRKYTFETSRLSQSLEESTAPKKAKLNPQANQKPRAEPAKRERGQRGIVTPPPKKKSRPPPVFKPLSKKPLPKPEWQTPPAKPSTTFRITKNLEPSPRSSEKQLPPTATSKPATAPVPPPKYAETPPFTFKLIVSYPSAQQQAADPNATLEYHLSTDLTSNMKTFWRVLERQLTAWETAAGAEWAWELQKPQNSQQRNGEGSVRRFCVSAKVAKQPTRWRAGDEGFYACRKCAMEGSLCFTWVREEGDDAVDVDVADQDGILSSKGEFWCLPVHPQDRRCEVKKDREIRTWLNEGDNSESDSSGEDGDGEDSECDEYRGEEGHEGEED